MSVSAIELQASRSSSDSNGKTTATRTFAVWNDASELTSPAAVRATFGTVAGSVTIPDVGDLFPDETDVYCIAYNISREDGSRGVWKVEYSYENTEWTFVGEASVGYVQFTLDWSAEFRDVWRVAPGLNVPANGSAGSNTQAGGSSIDVAGEPMSVLRYFATLEISETVPLTTLDARSAVIMATRGTRNSGVFRNGAIGSVLYKGAKASRISSNKASLTHSFVQDDWYHMIQYPKKLADGGTELLESTPGVYNAAIVYWRQPFPLFSDFNQLSENF